MGELENQLRFVNQIKRRILDDIDERNAKRSIECYSCLDLHEVQELVAIQTHQYVRPHGCTEGDYWTPGEMQFVCPDTQVVNRLLFGEKELERKFRNNYGHLFEKVTDSYEERTTSKWVNNFYIERNREEFDL